MEAMEKHPGMLLQAEALCLSENQLERQGAESAGDRGGVESWASIRLLLWMTTRWSASMCGSRFRK